MNLKDFKISFIIPVLNCDELIGKCLNSIQAEMKDCDEIIVVDNGSTDKTIEIVKSFSQAKLLDSTGKTIAATRNLGVKNSQADTDVYVFIDSDCLLAKGYRENAARVLNNPEIAATGSKVDLPPDPCWVEAAWYSNRKYEPSYVNYINSGNLVVRKSAFEAIDGFDENLTTDEDWDFGMRLNRADLCLLDDPTVKAIHLRNPKTLKQFFKKTQWHAISGLKLVNKGQIDKPMLMTAFFIGLFILSFILSPLFLLWNLSPFYLLPLIFLVPVITAIYRVGQFRNYKFIFQLIILYFVYYSARAVVLVKQKF